MREFTSSRGQSIGQASAKTGVNIETIRYYERIGIMPKPERTQGGNRLYDADLLKRLFFIKRCRELGFSIDEIRALLEMVDCRDFTCREVHEMTVNHLSSIREKIDTLQQLASVLEDMASKCNKGNVPQCHILGSRLIQIQ